MTTRLDLNDIQGNIIKGYGRFGFPKARYLFFNFSNGESARKFVGQLVPLITTGAPWSEENIAQGNRKPDVTTNVAFTYAGLRELGLPDKSMRSFPEDFRMGMKARRAILGDTGKNSPKHWDSIWEDNYSVHMWMSINGTGDAVVETRYQEISALVDASNGGVTILSGHSGPNPKFQAASAIYQNGVPTAKEHFDYVDGISDPYFEGQTKRPEDVIGAGKVTRKPAATPEGWEPIKTGEFLLGHRDETNEYPAAPIPRLLSYNGTFMVYRKLHENVGAFESYINEMGKYHPDGKEAIAAKFAGRWRNGAPITKYPTKADADAFGSAWNAATTSLFYNPEATAEEKMQARKTLEKLKKDRVAFKYDDDLNGSRCPLGSHIRRANPRGALEYGEKEAFKVPGALTDRRRILRRGLPYGDSSDRTSNDGDHGVIFMAINANIARQFEFVQQQWMNYGNDFKRSNEQDPIVSNQDSGRAIIEGDPKTGQPPIFCSDIPRFVETRGGEYFFIPSLTALRMIADGIIDPT